MTRGATAARTAKTLAWIVAMVAAGLSGAARADAAPRRATVFLDFGGGFIGPGDDSSQGQVTCVEEPFQYPIFRGSERASEIAVAEARRILAPYGVRVVAERPPPPLPYVHVRVGGDPDDLGLDPRLNGLACAIDCDDRARRETVFTFSEKWVDTAALPDQEEEIRAVQLGRIAVHEAGHSWGLEHAGASESVMARFPSAVDPAFVVGCQPLDVDREPDCAPNHARYCDPGQQDADAELRALFGGSEPDQRAPRAVIRWPPEDHVVPPGATVEVEVEVDDDYGGFGWMLEVPELDWRHVARHGDPTSLPLVVPEGRFTLRLEVVDHDRNVARAEVVVHARPPARGPSEIAGPRAECACRDDGGGGGEGPGWWLLMLAVGVLRGRRARPDRMNPGPNSLGSNSPGLTPPGPNPPGPSQPRANPVRATRGRGSARRGAS